jgi:hypothetical protein
MKPRPFTKDKTHPLHVIYERLRKRASRRYPNWGYRKEAYLRGMNDALRAVNEELLRF